MINHPAGYKTVEIKRDPELAESEWILTVEPGVSFVLSHCPRRRWVRMLLRFLRLLRLR